MYPRRHDHNVKEQKYNAIREIVFEEIRNDFGVNAKGVTLRDCQLANNWENLQGKGYRRDRGGWDWVELFKSYQNKPNRFEIALTSAGTLGALAYGQTSRAGSKVRLDFIESTPVRPSPLGMRSLPVISAAATLFADIVGADEIWVIEPFAHLEETYKSVGFGPRTYYHQKVPGQMKKRRLL
ncbi:hypothetical protein [Microbulbifer sp. TRSA007]|uniref:hypothetical protein n=1 Tax=Microbulbifer sp. TRSA007 TaxID=3243384 RepID=UPI004039CDEC